MLSPGVIQFLGISSGIIAFLQFPTYILSIFTKKVRPQRASWLIWSVLGTIAVASQVAEGGTYSVLMTDAQTVGTIVIFAISIKKGTGGLSRNDILALIAAAGGLILWAYTRHAAYALVITIFVDAIGAALTAAKAYRHPASESLLAWAFSGTAGLLGTAAVGAFNPILMAYPFYVFVANASVITGILLGKKRKHR
jgi:hypothetical protein